MAITGNTLGTTSPSGQWVGNGTATDIDNVRRTFGIGDQVAQLAPAESIFFSYLSKLGKKPIDETVWKPLEYRNQWQRRNFEATAAKVTVDGDGHVTAIAAPSGTDLSHFIFAVNYDKHGAQDSGLEMNIIEDADAVDYTGYAPIFLTPGQILRIGGINYKFSEAGTVKYWKWTADATADKSDASKAGTEIGYAGIAIGDLKVVSSNALVGNDHKTAAFSAKGQVNGSQWAEASGAPDGFRDELTSVEFYSQIFKTAVPLMSGSMMATKYRGFQNEWKRIYAEHLKAHKMDMENAFLFGYGKYNSADERTSWGAIPFLEAKGGKRYEINYDGGTAASTSDATYDVKCGFNYDGMVDLMDDFMAYETGNSGQKLILTSRKVVNGLHKMGDGNFLSNSFSKADGSATNNKEVFSASLDVKTSSFMPVDITSISTSYGSLNFVAHPLFRNDMENKAVALDLSNVALRPLAGNGISRDTFVETNVQENDIDGRKDMIITEAGLEVMLPETHAVIDFV